jgi:hypothetical protein
MSAPGAFARPDGPMVAGGTAWAATIMTKELAAAGNL